MNPSLELTVLIEIQLEVQRIGPAHCTGWTATAALQQAFPDRTIPCSVGLRLSFELARAM